MDEATALKRLEAIFRDEAMIGLNIGLRDLWFLDSVLALAWRHPELSAHQKNWIEHLHNQFQDVILDLHPDAMDLLAAGWDTAQDQPPDRAKTEAINRQYREMEKKYLRKTGRAK